MSATLSDLAEKYGVTKVTAKSRLVNLGLWDEHTHKDGRKYVIDDEAVEEFAKRYASSKKRASVAADKDKVAAAPAVVDNADLVAELRDMVDYLKRQLAQKDD